MTIVAVAASLLIAVSAGVRAPANAERGDPLMMRAKLTGSADLPDGAVTASVEPALSRLAKLAGGQQYSRFVLPTEAVYRNGDEIEVRFPPEDLPDAYVDEGGLVTVVIDAADAEHGKYGTVLSSVRRVTIANSQQWAPPMYSAESLSVPPAKRTAAQARAVAAKAPATTARAVYAAFDGDENPVEEVLADALPHATSRMQPTSDEKLARVASEMSALPPHDLARAVAASNCSLAKKERIRSATVGTSYPMLKGSKSWLTYNNSTSSSFGTAVNVGDGWYQGGGVTATADNWGSSFQKSHRLRSYRVHVIYRKQTCTSAKWGTILSQKLIPVGQTGGIGRNILSSRPSWRSKCAPVVSHKWWRGSTTGQSYTLSYGVKFEKVLGFNLKSERGYSRGARLFYTANKRRAICGDTTWPGLAGKMMERGWRARSY
ncbi:hypothetical protein [Nocardioides sambongensis]|uniref:hypothetical protein n=1 Tax=Nocardioides sambongensis TaxID=2589074 RepID=UPI00112AA7F9|nr:hypothetical protein [Nocardioides sambongensis]